MHKPKAWLIAAFIINAGLLYAYFRRPATQHQWRGVDRTASNSTLGFQSILAVAPQHVPAHLSWRREGLEKAARRTGLLIDISEQPIWTDDDLSTIKAKTKGYALSWLGHLNTLKEASKQSSTLIVEDDADWDVDLRSQMQVIASTIQNVTRQAWNGAVTDDSTHGSPYGTGWDVLWLGHCGDNIRSPYVAFEDPTVPPWYNSWEKTISPDPHHMRFVHQSAGPICTYAYAVTGETAAKLVADPNREAEAFDIWLHVRCKSGELRCITVSPELFHHHEMSGEKDGLINGKTSESVNHEMTDNIFHSARCNSRAGSAAGELVSCMGPKPV